ncbi:acetylxylan esterase [Paenibacillus sp.]|uniref:glucuronyl esterase domain-containing protein n=1 Tax=Paenibacillus sp. TaxID=58172 RepID=UPI002D2A0F31|nr:acetylxylan esterase [Paenibacillus sp.]HZG58255.1 acetylxylan esterase [Paenibacillus sp.]
MNRGDEALYGDRGLPDLFRMSDGKPVEDAVRWAGERRPEIIELFRKYVYGREPAEATSAALRFDVLDERPAMGGAAVRRRVAIRLEGPGGAYAVPLLLFVPTAAANGAGTPAPAFLFLNNRGAEHTDPERLVRSGFWPAERIVERGYAAAAIDVHAIDPDVHDGFANGVHGVFEPNPERRAPDAWGTIAAWAWGACRAMDYFETAPGIDASRVVVAGHSRCGKTALWAGATDPRFAMVVSNNSGCTGAALSRGKAGETIQDINERFPHWFNENYKSFNKREAELPVDQHFLLASIAPRHLYVTSATEDEWADPASEFASLLAAEPVFRLFGKPGLGAVRGDGTSDDLPAPNAPIHSDGLAYHLRRGEHDLTPYDWERFMDYADRYLRPATTGDKR